MSASSSRSKQTKAAATLGSEPAKSAPDSATSKQPAVANTSNPSPGDASSDGELRNLLRHRQHKEYDSDEGDESDLPSVELKVVLVGDAKTGKVKREVIEILV